MPDNPDTATPAPAKPGDGGASGHTPGPWSIEQNRKMTRDGCEDYLCISGSDWYCLAEVAVRMQGKDDDDHTGLANARLIALAPTLLAENAALRASNTEMLAALREMVAFYGTPGPVSERARAAIARATEAAS